MARWIDGPVWRCSRLKWYSRSHGVETVEVLVRVAAEREACFRQFNGFEVSLLGAVESGITINRKLYEMVDGGA